MFVQQVHDMIEVSQQQEDADVLLLLRDFVPEAVAETSLFMTLVAAGELRLVHARGTGGDLLAAARRLVMGLSRVEPESSVSPASPTHYDADNTPYASHAVPHVKCDCHVDNDSVVVAESSARYTRDDYAEFLVIQDIPDTVSVEDVALFYSDRNRALEHANGMVASAMRIAVDMILAAATHATDVSGGDVQKGLIRRHLRQQLGLPMLRGRVSPAERLGRIVASMIGSEVTEDPFVLGQMAETGNPHVFFEGPHGQDALIYLRHVVEAAADTYAVRQCRDDALVLALISSRHYPWEIARYHDDDAMSDAHRMTTQSGGKAYAILPSTAFATTPSLLDEAMLTVHTLEDATWHAIRTARFPAELRELSRICLEARRTSFGRDSLPAGIAGSLISNFIDEFGECDLLLDLLEGLGQCASADEAAGLFVEINQHAHANVYEHGSGAAVTDLALIDRVVYPALRSRELLTALWRSVNPAGKLAENSEDDIHVAIRDFIESCGGAAEDVERGLPTPDAVRLSA